jgi:PmbA protein
VEEILSLAKKAAEHAEVYQVSSRKTPVKFEANTLKQIETKESIATALRLIKDGRVGFAQASGPIKPDELVNMAVETSSFGTVATFEFPGSLPYPQVEIYDPQIEHMSIDDMVELGGHLIDTVRQKSPDIVCEASISRGIASVHIANTSGGEASYKKSFSTLGIEGVIVQDDDMLFVGDAQSSCHPILDASELAAEVLMQLKLAETRAEIVTQQMPVIFKPNGVASALIAPLISAFNGKIVLMGASPLKGKQGEKLFDDRISLWDDATLPFQVPSCPCDDEGVPGRRTPLIDKGVVSNFYYDLQTAGMAHTESTGNGGRNGGLPVPSINSLIIDRGQTSFKDMVEDIKDGLIIEQLMGATQGNILNGDFSGNVLLGYRIANGEIIGRVKNTMVSGNIYQILEQVEALGNDSRWVDGFLLTPSIYCPGVSVATKRG